MNRLWISIFLVPTLIAFSLGNPPSASAQFRDWNTRYGTWSNAANWNPGLVPFLTEIARIGNLPGAYDADVELDIDTAVGGLQIYNGMRLETTGHNMIVVTDTLITGSGMRGSELDVQNSIFETRDLINESRLRLSSGTVNVSRLLSNANNSVIFGGGTINLSRDSGVAFRNDGTIFTNGSPTLTVNQLGNGLIDLDGSTGSGLLRIAGSFAQETVTFNGTQLSDSFSGTIDLRSGNVLNMNFSNGWTADASSEINLLGNSFAVNPSRIQGGDWLLNGSLNLKTDLIYGSGSASIEADTVIGNAANVMIESNNSLQFGNTTINGGNFNLEQDANLSFSGNTLVHAGSFNTFNQTSSDGSVNFDGLTVWDGNVTAAGIIRQNGNAIVAGETTIDADVFDMDGNGNSNWSISSGLTVNTTSIDSTISNTFDGTISVVGGLNSQLTVNLQPGSNWTMAGQMNLSNPLNNELTRVAGSQMRLTGELNIQGPVGFQADLLVENPATIQFANADSTLTSHGTSLIHQNATFVGQGTLANSNTGQMTLADGLSLNDVSLQNSGMLHVGMGAGIVDVAEFINTTTGTLQIDIGGHLLGSEHDMLLTQGDAILGGWLQVDLVDIGSGLFLPEVGDEFTVLIALGGLSGTFLNDPVSQAGGHSYYWEVDYNPHDVTLRLASISIPEPGFAVLGLIGCTAMLFYRRERNMVLHHQ